MKLLLQAVGVVGVVGCFWMMMGRDRHAPFLRQVARASPFLVGMMVSTAVVVWASLLRN